MTPLISALRRTIVATVLVVIVAHGPPARGQSSGDKPRGIVAGPFLLAPYFEFSAGADSNVLRSSFQENTSDTATSAGMVFGAELPFKNSVAELIYQFESVDFTQNSLASSDATDVQIGVELNFRTGDRLVIRDRFIRDFVQVSSTNVGSSDIAEEAFFGEPYHNNRLDIQLSRRASGRQGYSMRISRRDRIYQGDAFVALYDYRGFDNYFEFRQPLSVRKNLVVRYSQRRFNHYDPNEDEPGVPFRREISDRIEAGLSGYTGPNQPWLIRVGWGRFKYSLVDSTNFKGITGFARWRTRIGGRSSASMSFSRRPVPSVFDTFYTINQLRFVAEKGFTPASKVALIFGASRNRYGDVIDPSQLNCNGQIRLDQIWDAGIRANWALNRVVGLRGTARHEQRSSNCEGISYESNAITTSITIGWF